MMTPTAVTGSDSVDFVVSQQQSAILGSEDVEVVVVGTESRVSDYHQAVLNCSNAYLP